MFLFEFGTLGVPNSALLIDWANDDSVARSSAVEDFRLEKAALTKRELRQQRVSEFWSDPPPFVDEQTFLDSQKLYWARRLDCDFSRDSFRTPPENMFHWATVETIGR
eukprot:7257193-Heterocapsa_arctica.AAC.1